MTIHLTKDLLWWERGWEARQNDFPISLADDTGNVPSRYREEWRRGWQDSDNALASQSPDAPKFHDLGTDMYTVLDKDGNVVG